MSPSTSTSIAEITERITQQAVLMTFFVALLYTVSAGRYLVNGAIDQYLGWMEKGLGIVVVVTGLVLLPLALKKRTVHSRCGATSTEGFINDMAKESFAFSWGLTILLLISLDVMDAGLISRFPSEFTTELIKAVLLGTFSIRFYFLNRGWRRDDDDTESKQ